MDVTNDDKATHIEDEIRQIGYNFAHLASESMLKVIEACMQLESCFRDFKEAMEEAEPPPATFRCRICGKHYINKGEAKGCEREHRRYLRR